MKVLFIADILGKPGRRVVQAMLPGVRESRGVDLTIANAENLAGGYGVTPRVVNAMLQSGVDVLTSGNHIWDRAEGLDLLEEIPRLLRPANYPAMNPGRGACTVPVGGVQVAVLNLQGRVFMTPIDDPFRIGDEMLGRLGTEAAVILVDFHAEATAEKIAFARFADGRAAAVVGTHTHVPTADARVLPGGTAYITDLGMTGSHAGVIGYRSDLAIERSRLGRRVRFQMAEGELRLQGALVEVDESTGLARSIERIDLPYDDDGSATDADEIESG